MFFKSQTTKESRLPQYPCSETHAKRATWKNHLPSLLTRSHNFPCYIFPSVCVCVRERLKVIYIYQYFRFLFYCVVLYILYTNRTCINIDLFSSTNFYVREIDQRFVLPFTIYHNSVWLHSISERIHSLLLHICRCVYKRNYFLFIKFYCFFYLTQNMLFFDCVDMTWC